MHYHVVHFDSKSKVSCCPDFGVHSHVVLMIVENALSSSPPLYIKWAVCNISIGKIKQLSIWALTLLTLISKLTNSLIDLFFINPGSDSSSFEPVRWIFVKIMIVDIN